jgi:hypothetical protein
MTPAIILDTPMRPESRVLSMSSGAVTMLTVTFIAPESLTPSGGYIGAKRMLWFMAHAANADSRETVYADGVVYGIRAHGEIRSLDV